MKYTLFKYAKISDHSVAGLANETVWFCRAKNLNDPYECSLFSSGNRLLIAAAIAVATKRNKSFSASIKRMRRIGLTGDSFQKDIEQTITDLQREYYVMSLSNKCDSPSMWGHYAAEYGGICIEYELDSTLHWHRPHALELGGMGEYIGRVRYSNSPPEYVNESGIKNKGIGVISLLTKQSEWVYENEYRMMVHQKDGPEFGIVKTLPPGSIKSVTIGREQLLKWQKEFLTYRDQKKFLPTSYEL